MTKLLTVPKFAQATGLSYRLCLQLVGSGEIPSVPVGARRRIDVRWVEQWLAAGGYRQMNEVAPTDNDHADYTRQRVGGLCDS